MHYVDSCPVCRAEAAAMSVPASPPESVAAAELDAQRVQYARQARTDRLNRAGRILVELRKLGL